MEIYLYLWLQLYFAVLVCSRVSGSLMCVLSALGCRWMCLPHATSGRATCCLRCVGRGQGVAKAQGSPVQTTIMRGFVLDHVLSTHNYRNSYNTQLTKYTICAYLYRVGRRYTRYTLAPPGSAASGVHDMCKQSDEMKFGFSYNPRCAAQSRPPRCASHAETDTGPSRDAQRP
jgi:hypothetical protein